MTPRCEKPLSFETLAALWAGDLPSDEAAAAEEHLFGCDECATASDRLAKLALALRETIPPIVSHAHRDRLVGAGMRIGTTVVTANTSADAYFKKDVDLLIHVLRADLSRAERVDVDVIRPGGALAVALEHVPFDASAGEVLVACQRHYQALSPGGDPTFRVHAFEPGGERRTMEYLVVHHWE